MRIEREMWRTQKFLEGEYFLEGILSELENLEVPRMRIFLK